MAQQEDIISIFSNPQELNQRFQQIKKKVLAQSDIIKFLELNQQSLAPDAINQSLSALNEYADGVKICPNNAPLDQCKSMMKGYNVRLRVNHNGLIETFYIPCAHKKYEASQQQFNNLFTTFNVSERVKTAQFNEIIVNSQSKAEVVKYTMDILDKIYQKQPLDKVKGLYIHGDVGIGKTYLLCAIANDLRAHHYASTMIYLPEFIRDLKQGIRDNSYHEQLNFIRQQPILFIDDFGAEDLTPWVRDEIIGPLLNYRMMNGLLTFISSNFSVTELEVYLAQTKQGNEPVKAMRLIERIKTLTQEFYIEGENLRHQ